MTDLYILGAPDPEMAAIESLLTSAGQRIAYALDPEGKRVHPGNAYAALMPIEVSRHLDDDGGHAVVLVECCDAAARGTKLDPRIFRADHHRPGDPGYDKQPAEFLSGSSLGQVIARLAALDALPADWIRSRSTNFPIGRAGRFGVSDAGQWAVGLPDDPPLIGEDAGGHPVSAGWLQAIIPDTVVLIAAADHCPGHAYAGLCHGVEPDVLLAWRMMSAAAFQEVRRQLADRPKQED